MGSLGGHVLPGSFFIVYGCWWVFISFWLQLTTSKSRKACSSSHANSSISYAHFKRDIQLGRLTYIPQPFCIHIPFEPLFKIILSFIGVMVETFLSAGDGKIVAQAYVIYEEDGSFRSLSKLQHITMYSGFLLSGVVDLIGLVLRLPKNTTKLFFSLAFLVEGILFMFHADGRGDLNRSLHILLTYAIFSGVIFSGLRMLQTGNILINSGLGFSIILQGTWFIQVGVTLFGEQPWNEDDHENISFIIACFTWHISSIMVTMFIFYIFLMACIRGSVKYRSKVRKRGIRFSWPIVNNNQDNGEKDQLIEVEKEMEDLTRKITKETVT